MNPNRHATSYYDYFKDLIRGDGESTEAHRKFYDEYNAVLDMDAEYYLDTIETVFQEFKLVNGTWDVKGVDGQIERVRPQDITKTAVLAIEGELDDIAGLGQTQASLSMCSGVPDSEKLYYEVKGAGHYGIFSGRRWREMAYPVLRDFILRHHSGIVTAKRRKASQPHLDDLAKRAELYEQLQLGQEASSVEPAPAVAEVAPAEPVKAAPKARTAARKTAAKPASRAGSTRKTATKAAATEAPAAAEKAAPASAPAAKAVTGTAPAQAAEKAIAPATTAEASPKAETVAAAPAAVAPAAATSKEAPQADAGKSAEVPPQQAADSAIVVQADASTSKPMTTWRLPGSVAEEQTTDQAMADSQQS
jgi:poly(3-hydroxybutyrate) depolymerase